MNRKRILNIAIWFFEGVAVGFGAILPGVSGGTLCVAFGMYPAIISLLSDIRSGFKKYALMLSLFALGAAVGFVGLSGMAARLISKSAVIVTCVFIGLIVGTLPKLWKDAGEQGRSLKSYLSLFICFLLMSGILLLLKSNTNVTMSANFFSYVFCGILWGLSFIIPGLSSSSLLLFFGLYQPMLVGISKLDFSVLLPMALGMAACVAALAKLIGAAYRHFYSVLSHGIFGIVVATTIMILPSFRVSVKNIAIYLICIICGAAASYVLTLICDKIKISQN